jgi:hypothetical protein
MQSVACKAMHKLELAGGGLLGQTFTEKRLPNAKLKALPPPEAPETNVGSSF